MAERPSGFERVERDKYETPEWVVLDCLAGYFPIKGSVVIEPACGTGKMVAALYKAGASKVLPSDIESYPMVSARAAKGFQIHDFTKGRYKRKGRLIISNPPYGPDSILAEQFIERGLEMMRAPDGPDGMFYLLSAGFDLAQSRTHLLERCPEHVGQIKLRRRIEWFPRQVKQVEIKDEETGEVIGTKAERGSGPSKHHAWYIWTKTGRPPGTAPCTLYAPSDGVLL